MLLHQRILLNCLHHCFPRCLQLADLSSHLEYDVRTPAIFGVLNRSFQKHAVLLHYGHPQQNRHPFLNVRLEADQVLRQHEPIRLHCIASNVDVTDLPALLLLVASKPFQNFLESDLFALFFNFTFCPVNVDLLSAPDYLTEIVQVVPKEDIDQSWFLTFLEMLELMQR